MALDLPGYDTLSSMYLAPMSGMMAQDNMDLKSQFAQQQLMKQQQDNEFATKQNPLLLQEAEENLKAKRAQLPGIVANSSLAQDKAKLSRDSISQQMEELLGSFKGKVSAQELSFLQNAGSAFGQTGALLGTLPLSIRKDAAKRLLGKFWQPEFDGMEPTDLTDTLSTMGEWMGKAQTKFQQQQSLVDQKGNNALALAETKALKQQQLEAYKNSIKAATASSKVSGNKETLKNTQAAIYNEIRKETDPDKQAALQVEFDNITRIISDMDVRTRAAGNAGKPDVKSLGFQEQGLPNAPTLGNNPTVKPSSGSPAQNRPQSLADLQKLYPGVPPEKLKAAFKKKFGIDIKE